MVDVFFNIMGVIIKIFSPVLYGITFIIFMIVLNIIYYIIKGQRFKKSEYKRTYKKRSLLLRIFFDFPNRLAKDLLNKDPDEFPFYGLHCVCGEQGSGKTITVVKMLMDIKAKYPRTKIRTNMNYKYEDGQISHWKDIVLNDNGVYGQVEVIDEIQTWFSSLQSKDFPPEMLTEISQQRKQRKMIVGTAQVFSRIAKPIREQTTFVYLPMTLFGCLTIVRKTKAEYWDNEKQKFKRYNGMYFFVHTDEIRNAFDTYQKIQKYNEEGFKSDFERNILISNDISIIQK